MHSGLLPSRPVQVVAQGCPESQDREAYRALGVESREQVPGAGIPLEWLPEAIVSVLPGFFQGSLFRGLWGGCAVPTKGTQECHQRERKTKGGNPSLRETGRQEPLTNE